MDVDIIISINIYKSPNTLKLQLNNIKENVLNSYCVILNCNKYMFDYLSTIELPENVFINPEIIEKKRFHGTLLQGIISNMHYVFNKFKFKYFLILSGRTIFYRNINTENLDILQKKFNNIDEINSIRNIDSSNLTDWMWPKFRATKLMQLYIKLKYQLMLSNHEGLIFNYNVFENIINFLNKEIDIENDLINFEGCVEEFALQTIAHNEINIQNLNYSFINISIGVDNGQIKNENTYVEKIDWLD